MHAILQRRWLIIAALVMLPLIVYARSLGNGFVNWDDGLLILDNAWIRGLTWENIKHAFTSYDPELYIPLTLLSYQVTYAVVGLSPFLYHAGNLALHICNTLLIFSIALQLTKRMPVAFAAGVLFAIHPLNTEAVAWAAARKDVLSTAFLLLTFATFLRHRETAKSLWYAGSILSFCLGLLSKVGILTAPLVLIGFDWMQGQVSFRRALRDASPFFALSILFGIVSLFGKIPQDAFLYDKLLIGARAITLHVQKLFFPWNLTAFYPYTQPISLSTPDLLLSAIIVVLITAGCVFALQWSKWPLFAWVIFLLLLVPSFGNIIKGRNDLLDVYITTDRYSYAASVGPLLLAGLLFDEIQLALRSSPKAIEAGWRWKRTGWSVAAAMILLFSFLAYRQSMTWKDSETFFRHAVAVSPNSYIAHQNIGTILGKRGDFDGALKEYEVTLRIRPDAATYYNLGQIAEYQGDIDAAIKFYEAARDTAAMEFDARLRLGILLSKRGRKEETMAVLREALEIQPGNEEILKMLEAMK